MRPALRSSRWKYAVINLMAVTWRVKQSICTLKKTVEHLLISVPVKFISCLLYKCFVRIIEPDTPSLFWVLVYCCFFLKAAGWLLTVFFTGALTIVAGLT